MNKRRASIDPAQLGFTFTPPVPARAEADLAGLDRVVAAIVAAALKGDARSRHEIAGAASALLGGDEANGRVSKEMLDAYASEARGDHNISAARLLALVAVTERFDLLDALVRRIGAALLVGEELHAARLGHLKARERALKAEIKKMEAAAQPIQPGADVVKRNRGHLPAEAAGKRVRVRLANGELNQAHGWAADGRGACRWTRTGCPFDIDFYEVIA